MSDKCFILDKEIITNNNYEQSQVITVIKKLKNLKIYK
jgi:hypothetical protein